MNEDHEQDKPEPVDDVIEITNQPTAAVPTTHTSGSLLLSHVTQLATTRKDHVTFWSLPHEVRDMIWSEVLGPEDDIFQANVITSVCDNRFERRPHIHDASIRYARRGDGRFNRTDHAPMLLSSRPPLPLAHLCQESQAFALLKYDAAYRKVRGPNLNLQERGGRFRWLSRSTPRLMEIVIDDGKHDKRDIEVPLGEDERLILLCQRYSIPPWERTGNKEAYQDRFKQPALLELLKKAKDYQIMICSKTGFCWGEPYRVDRNIARNWGVFAGRAPGRDFSEDRATNRKTRIFLEVRDTFSMVQLLRDINRRGRTVGLRSLGLRTHIVRDNTTTITKRISLLTPILRSGDLPYFTADGFRRLEEDELFPDGYILRDLKDREWLQEIFSECMVYFERLWAKNVNEEEISSQSRYGRMPKVGLVFEHDVSFTWADRYDYWYGGG